MLTKTPVLPLDEGQIKQLPDNHKEGLLLGWYCQEKVSLLHFCKIVRDQIRRGGNQEMELLQQYRQQVQQHLAQMTREIGKVQEEALSTRLQDMLRALHLEVQSYLEST